jgi:hypothetical protein
VKISLNRTTKPGELDYKLIFFPDNSESGKNETMTAGAFLALWNGSRPDPNGFPLINRRGWFKYYR